MQIKNNGKAGFTLVEIMIVVAIIGLLAAIAIPNFVRARESAQLNSIANNLRILEGAKEQYALENKLATSAMVGADDLTSYLKGNAMITPAAGEAYNLVAADISVGALVSATISGPLGTHAANAVLTVTSF